ncbi:MAG: cytochrome c biogenesis CcdA family protein [Candidatus Woesearchaeota archaeon]
MSPEFLVIAFLGGLLTFFSPCIAPLMPGYLTFLAGTSMHESKHRRRIALFTALFFVLGLATVFSLVGGVLTVLLSGASANIARTIEVIGGFIIIAFGILLSGLVRVPLLEREVRWHPQKGASRYPNAFIFGAAFGVGWSPCIGAILGAILTLAVVQPASGFALLFAYSLGLGVPFLALSLFIEPMTAFIKKSRRAFRIITLIAAGLLIVLGVLLITGDFQSLASGQYMARFEWVEDLQERLVERMTSEAEPRDRTSIGTSEPCDPTITDCAPNP